jgi:hypothetical protein
VAVRVASVASVASATSPPVSPMVGAPAVAASATRVAMRDELTIAASSCSAVATLRGSAGICTSTVGIGRQLGPSTVTTEVGAATCGFVVTVPDGGRLSHPVVDSHEVSVFCKLGNDFSCAHPLSLTCDRCDRHEALLRGSVYPTLDLVESLCEVADGEVVSKTPAPLLRFLLRSRRASLLASVSSAGASADSSSAEISSRYRSSAIPEGPGVSPAAMKTWRSGLPRPESELATSVGMYSSARASGVPSWKGSESR